MGRSLSIPQILATIFWLLAAWPTAGAAEFYQYRDDQGRRHFVDDLGRVPEEYLDQVETHRSHDDGLSAEERETRDRALEQRRGRWMEEHINSLRQKTLEHLSEREAQRLETPIRFSAGQVLLPVQLGYGRREVTAELVLDTGASITALHREVADRLAVRNFQKARAQVAGGQIIDVDLATLDYIRVGPFERRDIRASFLDFSGDRPGHSGLLGMNFLQGLHYRIDYDRQVIRWEP
ncbi:MAG: aspartyl protease family protein [Thermodesulfobacteriota bacterium]